MSKNFCFWKLVLVEIFKVNPFCVIPVPAVFPTICYYLCEITDAKKKILGFESFDK
jgi:hypothetical protein